MKYQIVGKNIEVTEAMRSVIADKLKVLEKFFIVGENVECRVLVRTYKVGQKIEVTIPTKVAVLRAEVINENIYNGVDEAVEIYRVQYEGGAKNSQRNTYAWDFYNTFAGTSSGYPIIITVNGNGQAWSSLGELVRNYAEAGQRVGLAAVPNDGDYCAVVISSGEPCPRP